MAGGRPLKFATVEDLQEKIDAYFASVEKDDPITITGLALALDTSRETLCNYEENVEFFDAIKRAKLRCENYAEKQLFNGKNAAGPIFALKNYNWRDKQEQSIDFNGNLNVRKTDLTDEALAEIIKTGSGAGTP